MNTTRVDHVVFCMRLKVHCVQALFNHELLQKRNKKIVKILASPVHPLLTFRNIVKLLIV